MTAPRKRMFYVNKYQMRILVLVLAPPVIIISVMALLSSLFFDQLLTAVESGSSTSLVDFLNDWKLNFVLVLWGLLTVVVVMTYVVSKNILGAFTRLFREMDEVLAGEREAGPLKARKRDQLANELLQRVNRLTDKASDVG